MDAFSLISIPFIALLVGVVSQLGFLLNSDVVNGGRLTWMGAALGAMLALAFALVRRRTAFADRLTVHYPYEVSWFKRLVNWPLLVLMPVIASTLALAVVNRAGSRGVETQAEYTVTELGSRRVGHGRYVYVGVTDGARILRIKSGDDEQRELRVGQSVKVTTAVGRLGFPYVTAVVPLASAHPRDR